MLRGELSLLQFHVWTAEVRLSPWPASTLETIRCAQTRFYMRGRSMDGAVKRPSEYQNTFCCFKYETTEFHHLSRVSFFMTTHHHQWELCTTFQQQVAPDIPSTFPHLMFYFVKAWNMSSTRVKSGGADNWTASWTAYSGGSSSIQRLSCVKETCLDHGC